MSILHDLVYWATVKPRLERLQKLLPEAEVYPAGSRYVCDPPSMFTDVDFLVYSETSVHSRLVDAKYSMTEFRNYGGNAMKEFTGWRKGVINLIVADTRQYADTFNTATCISKQYNLTRKWNRIVVHEILRDYAVDMELHEDMPEPCRNLLEGLRGPYKAAIYKAYRIQHGLEKSNV